MTAPVIRFSELKEIIYGGETFTHREMKQIWNGIHVHIPFEQRHYFIDILLELRDKWLFEGRMVNWWLLPTYALLEALPNNWAVVYADDMS